MFLTLFPLHCVGFSQLMLSFEVILNIFPMNKFERKMSINSAVLHIRCDNQHLNCSIFCKVDDDLVTLLVVTLTCPWFKTRGSCSEILLSPQKTAAQDSSLYTQRCGSGLCVLSRVNWTLSCSNKCTGLTASVWWETHLGTEICIGWTGTEPVRETLLHAMGRCGLLPLSLQTICSWIPLTRRNVLLIVHKQCWSFTCEFRETLLL